MPRAAVHRDVKGDNVRVRRSDGRAMLTDFGAGNYPGAATLTPRNVLPGHSGLPRSGGCGCSRCASARGPGRRYSAGPADRSLFAGSHRLPAGHRGSTPSWGSPRQDEAGTWQLEEVAPSALARAQPSVRHRRSSC